jgi:hypothetical protein
VRCGIASLSFHVFATPTQVTYVFFFFWQDDDGHDEDITLIETNEKKKKPPKGKKEGLKQSAKSCPVCFVPLTITLTLRSGEDSASVVEPNSSKSATADTCIICMDRPRNALLLPCGHMFTWWKSFLFFFSSLWEWVGWGGVGWEGLRSSN